MSESNIDDVLRAAATARPRAEVEEEVLLRLLDELAVTGEAVDSSVAELTLVDLGGGTGVEGVRRPLLLAAAIAIAVAVTAAVVALGGRPETETEPADTPEQEEQLTIGDACSAELPTLESLDVYSPAAPPSDRYPEIASESIERLMAAMRSSIDDHRDVRTALDELQTILDQIAFEAARVEDSRVALNSAAIDTLAGRAQAVMAGLGIAGCSTPDD